MRVISGLRKGHKLKAPSGKDTRPTEDKIKESLFNILVPLKEDAIILDLFAGTGSIGIEFLSRGAKISYFVDSSYDSIKTIKENLSHTKLLDKAEVYKKDSVDAIKLFKKDELIFDYIYIDPPFDKHDLLFDVLENLNKYPILDMDSLILIEHEKKLELEGRLNGFKIVDFRDYRNKGITFIKFA